LSGLKNNDILSDYSIIIIVLIVFYDSNLKPMYLFKISSRSEQINSMPNIVLRHAFVRHKKQFKLCTIKQDTKGI